ncbi:MAG: helix-turn-helix domain-containing protein [Caulobacter sp.]
MSPAQFDGRAFFSALDAQRQSRKLTWKKVAEEADVSASTLTRISQGRRPDVDSLACLCSWAGIAADQFMRPTTKRGEAETLTSITAHLRADPKLSEEGVAALEALLKTAYERLRKD